MSDALGSSRLTPEQRQWWEQRFHGLRYTVVQEQPARPNRKQRRLQKRKRRVAE